MGELIPIVALMIPITAIGSITFLIYQKIKISQGRDTLSPSEKIELEELRQRIHHLEIIASDSDTGNTLGTGAPDTEL